MTYWRVTDKILTGAVNFWKCAFLKFCLSLVEKCMILNSLVCCSFLSIGLGQNNSNWIPFVCS